MLFANPALYEALRRYTREALRLLSERNQSGVPIPVASEQEDWAWRSDLGMFERQMGVPLWHYYYQQSLVVLQELPEHRAAVDALWADAVIAGQLGVLVGTVGIQRTYVPEVMLARIVSDILSTQGGFMPLDDETFDNQYRAMEDAFHSDSVQVRVIAPLLGFVTEATPIRLEENFTIDRLTADEQLRYMHLGQIVVDNLARSVPVFGVRASAILSKVVGDPSPEQEQELRDFMLRMEAFDEMLQELMHALSAFKGGYCSTHARGAVLDWWFEGTPRRDDVPAVREQLDPTYILDRVEAHDFAEFWHAFKSPGVRHSSRKYLGVALRRLRYAGERLRAEDRVVDLMIAAEALFIGMTGADVRTELSFRVSMYAASLLGRTRDERLSVFEEMRAAYDVRSKIVHGGSVNDATVELTATSLEARVRAGLLHLIEQAARESSGGKKLIEPADLLFL